MTHKIILVGNPNTGKTTLFNTMTKSFEKASNWHGVTVGVKSKKYIFKGDEYVVTDVPGIYSLKAFSTEEKIAIEYLQTHKNDLVINICDANNIKRNLLLTSELINNGYKVIMVANMHNEICLCDYEKLSRLLGIIIIPIDARKKKDIIKVNNIIQNYANKNKTQNNTIKTVTYDIIVKNNDIFYRKDPYKTSDKIDKIILNKALFIPLFLFTMFMVFYFTFGDIGEFISDGINILFNKIANNIHFIINSLNISSFIKNFINEAIIDSCLSILSFLPQIILLMFFLNLIEDIGLMSRFAFMFDGLLKNIGLSGKSLFSLFMGFGCSTSAIISTRNLEDLSTRKKTISLIPLIPCSAKLPILLVIVSLFFEKYKYLIVFAFYIFSLIILIIVSILLNKRNNNKESLVIEMPKYRVPNVVKIIKDTIGVLKDFLLKISKTILIFSVIVWLLQNLSLSLIYLNGENFDDSLLYFLASKLKFLFAPIGLDNVGIIVSLILGLCAKELIVVGLCMINGVGFDLTLLTESLLNSSSICCFTSVSAIVFLVFILLYSPCISAISAMKNEINKKFTFYMIALQSLFAYLVSFIVYMILTRIYFVYLILSIIGVVIVSKIVLKLKHKNIICQGNCNVCRKI